MNDFWHDTIFCLGYLGLLGAVSFVVGRLFPKSWFRRTESPWFRSHRWEKNGRLYEKLGVRRWKNAVPDMSKLFSFMMSKSVRACKSVNDLDEMIHETCVAEVVHEALAVLGVTCVVAARSRWWIFYAILYFVGNLPYIMIQRYNRPRLMRLQKSARKHIEKAD